MNWRDQKRKARGDIHRQFQLPAVYLSHAEGVPTPVRVRLHQKPAQSQPMPGDWADAASIMDLNDRIIFEAAVAADLVLNSAYVIFSPDEGYHTGSSEPPREGYVSVIVSPMDAQEVSDLLAGFDLSTPEWAEIV